MLEAAKMTLDDVEDLIRAERASTRTRPFLRPGNVSSSPFVAWAVIAIIGESAPRDAFTLANDGRCTRRPSMLRHLNVHEHTAEPDPFRLIEDRQRVSRPSFATTHRVPALLEQTLGHQLVDRVVLDQENAERCCASPRGSGA